MHIVNFCFIFFYAFVNLIGFIFMYVSDSLVVAFFSDFYLSNVKDGVEIVPTIDFLKNLKLIIIIVKHLLTLLN